MNGEPAPDPYAGRTTLRRAYMFALVGYAVLFLSWIRQGWGGPWATRAFVDVGTLALALGAGALCLLRTRHLPGERKIAWVFLGLACLAWGSGQVAWTYLELWSQRGIPMAERAVPFPSVADVGYVLLLPLAAGALLVMIIGRTQATTRLRTLLDGILIAASMVFAAWVLFLRPIVAYAADLDRLGAILSLVYPVGDVVLLSLLVLVASRMPPQVQRTMAWLGFALLALTVADVGFWYYVANDAYGTGLWSDLGWSLGFLVIGYAAIRPIPDVPPHEVPRPGLALSALPLAPFVFSTGLAMMVQVTEGALSPFLFWNAILVVGTLAVRQFVMVYENLQLRRETEVALERANEAHRLRTGLLHNITHDLQNPLSPIQIQLHLLEGHADADVNRRLGIIRRNVDQIKRLVSDLSDVGKLQDGRLTIVRTPIDLAAIVRDVGESFRPLAAERGVTLEHVADTPVPVEGDTIRLRQVLANLVSNAIKFTPAGGTVKLRTRLELDHVGAEVVDSGRGLAPEEAARLFQPFSQVHRPEESPERGTGLGLFISRGLAEAHGGTLTVASEGRGKGSTFALRLPRRTDPLPQTTDLG